MRTNWRFSFKPCGFQAHLMSRLRPVSQFSAARWLQGATNE
jgi:hypothetical protein